MTSSLSATIAEILEKIFGEDKDEFLADPDGYLADAGLDDLSCADFDDALSSFYENSEFQNERGPVDLGGRFNNDNDSSGGSDNDRETRYVEREDDESDSEAIVRYLTNTVQEITYITNNNDDRDTYVDNSFQGTVLGDAEFDNDTVVASGDGAAAAGGDIEDSNIVSGDGNAIGDGNVTGDDNVVGDENQVGDGAFGEGSIQGGVTVDDGSGFGNAGGTGTGSQDDNSEDNDTRTEIDNSNEDSFNEDNDTTTETDIDTTTEIDSSQDNDTETSNDFSTNNSGNVEDSGNTTVRADIDELNT